MKIENHLKQKPVCKEIKEYANLWRERINTHSPEIFLLLSNHIDLMGNCCEECKRFLHNISLNMEGKVGKEKDKAISEIISRVTGEEIEQQTIYN